MYRVHPLADVQSLTIGQDTTIWQFCVVLKGASIGEECNICAGCLIENEVKIGNRVTIKSGVQVWDGVEIEDDVFVGPNATFTNDLIPRSKAHKREYAKTIIRKGASVGANATIVAGIEVGKYALIGAGGVVTKNVPAYQVWYGNPAKHKGFVTKDAILLGLDLVDPLTGNQYYIDNNELYISK